ncbi:hypothetical protein AAG747_06865 [Rapidithrix thailandica]|uniref:Uncharacterized protein n=1 Tax=Rapidithrix thailandica TaxID=413964 RepID=A0AAW9S5A6_9BACT
MNFRQLLYYFLLLLGGGLLGLFVFVIKTDPDITLWNFYRYIVPRSFLISGVLASMLAFTGLFIHSRYPGR